MPTLDKRGDRVGAIIVNRKLIQDPLQFLTAARLLQLADGFGLDLANPLAGDLEDVADFFQRVAVAVPQTVAELNDLPLAIAQALEHAVDAVSQHLLASAGGRAFGRAVGQKIAEVA